MTKDQTQKCDPLVQYRSDLIALLQKSQEQFDKAIITLSGGALGISFSFINKFIKTTDIVNEMYLILSWSSWGFSIACALLGFYLSPLAIERAIKQVDSGKIHEEHPGGFLDIVVRRCNLLSALLFLIGIVFIIIFVSHNYKG